MKNMKAKIVIVMISGLLAGSVAVSAQDTPAAAPAVTESSATSTNTVAQPAAVDASATSTNAVSPLPTTADGADSHAVSSNTVAVIPLIVMDEVPLSTRSRISRARPISITCSIPRFPTASRARRKDSPSSRPFPSAGRT